MFPTRPGRVKRPPSTNARPLGHGQHGLFFATRLLWLCAGKPCLFETCQEMLPWSGNHCAKHFTDLHKNTAKRAPRVSEECKIAQLSNQAHMQQKYIQEEAEFSLTLHFEKQEAISCFVGQFILKSVIKKEQASEGRRHRVPISCGKCCRDVTLLRSYLRILWVQ